MQVKQLQQDYSNILHWTDIASSIYLPALLMYLHSTNLTLSLGSFQNMNMILFLASAELLKYFLFAHSHKVSVHKHLKDILKSGFALFAFFAVTYIITVLFGAAAFSNFQETIMFSLLTTTLAALPLCLYFSPETVLKMCLSITSYEGKKIQNLFLLKVRVILLGAWLGAFVVPLDWNRPWQKWPVPCCVGVIMGAIVANWVTSVLQYKCYKKLPNKTGKFAL